MHRPVNQQHTHCQECRKEDLLLKTLIIMRFRCWGYYFHLYFTQTLAFDYFDLSRGADFGNRFEFCLYYRKWTFGFDWRLSLFILLRTASSRVRTWLLLVRNLNLLGELFDGSCSRHLFLSLGRDLDLYIFGGCLLLFRFLSKILSPRTLSISLSSAAERWFACTIKFLISDVLFEVDSRGINVDLELKFIVLWKVDF